MFTRPAYGTFALKEWGGENTEDAGGDDGDAVAAPSPLFDHNTTIPGFHTGGGRARDELGRTTKPPQRAGGRGATVSGRPTGANVSGDQPRPRAKPLRASAIQHLACVYSMILLGFAQGSRSRVGQRANPRGFGAHQRTQQDRAVLALPRRRELPDVVHGLQRESHLPASGRGAGDLALTRTAPASVGTATEAP